MAMIAFDVDDDDHAAITAAIARYQATHRVGGELMIAEGEGDLGGRILAELCRDWSDYWDRVCAGCE